MIISKRRKRVRAVSALAALALVVAACSGDDDDDASSDVSVDDTAAPTGADSATTEAAPSTSSATGTTGEPTAGSETTASDSATTTGEPVDCTGEPITFTAITTGTGPASFPSVARDTEQGTTAALAAVNSTCATGRPIEITLCDDKSDPNESTACGRGAAGDGSLGIVISTGLFAGGAEASALPAVLTNGTNQFDFTNPNSYPATSAITQILASVSAAAGLGADDYLLVAIDSAQARFLVDLATQSGASFGVTVEGLFFPPETTDFSPIAAQVTSRNPSSIGMIVPSVVPFINAMDAEGISPQDIPMFTSVNLVPPEVVTELGDKISGALLLSQSTPAQEEDNPGIAQMLSEYEAAGIDTPVDEIGTFAVDAWSKVHVLAEALATLSPEKIGALDPATVVEAVVGLGTVERPEMAPFDVSTPAFPQGNPLADFRIFTKYSAVVRVDDGTYRAVAPFSDATQPIPVEPSD